jgi:carbon storage regulator
MLILTRRFEEGIRIGDDIHVVVLGINGNQVRIGIQAPRELVVLRDEVYERQQAERAAAATQHRADDSGLPLN